MAVGFWSKIKSIASKIGKGLSLVNDKVIKPFVLPVANKLGGALGPAG
jgi:hypothetical protein